MLKTRFCYLFFLIASGTLAYFVPSSSITLFFYLVLITPLFSLLHVFYTIVFLSYTQQLEDRFIIKSQSVSYVLTLMNKTPIPFCRIVAHHCTYHQDAKNRPTIKKVLLAPYDNSLLKINVDTAYWGMYQLGLDRLIFTDLLGLVRIKSKLKKPITYKVHPRIVEYPLLPAFSTDDKDSIEALLHNGFERDDYDQVRNYRYGDALKDIHWKITARHSDIMVKDYRSETSHSVNLLLDVNGVRQHKVADYIQDGMIELGIAIAHLTAQDNIPLGYMNSVLDADYAYFTDFDHAYAAIDQTLFHDDMLHTSQIIDKVLEDFDSHHQQHPHIVFVTSQPDDTALLKLSELLSLGFHIQVVLINSTKRAQYEPEQRIAALGFTPCLVTLDEIDYEIVGDYVG